MAFLVYPLFGVVRYLAIDILGYNGWGATVRETLQHVLVSSMVTKSQWTHHVRIQGIKLPEDLATLLGNLFRKLPASTVQI